MNVILFIQARYAKYSFKMKNAIDINVLTDIPRFVDIGRGKKAVEEAKAVLIFTGRTNNQEQILIKLLKMKTLQANLIMLKLIVA